MNLCSINLQQAFTEVFEHILCRGVRKGTEKNENLVWHSISLRAFCWSFFLKIRSLVQFLTELLRVQRLETRFR